MRFFKEGDTIFDEGDVIIEIISKKGRTLEEIRAKIRESKGSQRGFVNSHDLLDDPAFEGKADPDKIYIFEKRRK